VRKFVREFEVKEKEALKRGSEDEGDSEDEEIVFIGRDANENGITMSDEVKDVMKEKLEREKKIYESLVRTPKKKFAKWLIHCVARYYRLSSKSVTVSMRREAYVSIREMREGLSKEMPRPLWRLI
jgi:chromosomal replication initiation ATPase DnaA